MPRHRRDRRQAGINQLGKLEMEGKQLAIDLKEAKKGTQDHAKTSKDFKLVKSNIEALLKETLRHTNRTSLALPFDLGARYRLPSLP